MKGSILQQRSVACAAVVFCTLLWGTAFPFIKLGYSRFEIGVNDIGSKLLFAGLRFFTAGAMVVLSLCIKNRKAVLLSKSDIAPICATGLVQTAGQYIFTYIGIGLTSGTNTSIITACASFFTVLCAPLFFKNDKLTMLKLLGCALGFCGVIAINGVGALRIDTLLGDSLILASTICAAAGNIISKKATLKTDPVKLTGFQLMLGGLVLTLAGFFLGGSLNILNAGGMLILLWLSLVSAVAFSIWTVLLKYNPASKITVFNLLVPVFGTILSGLMLGENVFKIETFISLVLISLGIVAVNSIRNS